ncbi:hypothetical protein LWI29_035291 [Acer saccharum]|uniref:Uncharacterized protein n=1 Tax=Acer saccharum TaxID=4024 RepID=A0AA39VNF3_ACESA|nr:hypothetical protein LWI29_035291 [Acer saccharum]
MLKIWGNEPRERARGGQTTCGHLASPCGRPWAPRAREPSAPVGPTRPPRGADGTTDEEEEDMGLMKIWCGMVMMKKIWLGFSDHITLF